MPAFVVGMEEEFWTSWMRMSICKLAPLWQTLSRRQVNAQTPPYVAASKLPVEGGSSIMLEQCSGRRSMSGDELILTAGAANVSRQHQLA